jgi:hypothetical protein
LPFAGQFEQSAWNRRMHRSASILTIAAAGILVARSHAAPMPLAGFPDSANPSSYSVAAAIANVPTNAGIVYDAIGQTNSIQVYNFGQLVYSGPIDVTPTLERIRHGCWIPAEKHDGGFFSFKHFGEMSNVPRKGNYYYREFVVWPGIDVTNATYDPGERTFGVVAFPGPMRLLIGLGGEVYFTGDHYGGGAQTNAYYVNPPPPPGVFHITSVVAQGPDALITWQTVGGETNVVQATAGTSGGHSNSFIDISPIIVGCGGDLTSTNYLDIGGATNFPARRYRIRLVP